MTQNLLVRGAPTGPGLAAWTADAGVLEGTPVLTAGGEMAVEHLAPGDAVITRAGLRRLVAVEVAEGALRPVVRIAPRSFGGGRPEAEVTMAPGQKALIRDWRARALWGKAQLAVPALRLADGEMVRRGMARGRLLRLRFAEEAVIYAGGVELAF